MKIEYTKNITLEGVSGLTREILEKIEPYCSDKDCMFDIRLALEEALVNAVKYGNKCDSTKAVSIGVTVQAQRLTVEIKDQGEGFDFENLAIPTDSENLEKLSGRGVFLIKNIMDTVEFLENGTKIRMMKLLK